MAVDPISLGVGLLPSLFKTISGFNQTSRANKINPIDPGYAVNNAVIDNARTLSNRASNFSIAGYGNAVNNINSSANNAFNSGVAGASSGGDVLDLASKIAYGQGQNLNQLAVANAQGADNALLQSLNANAQAGQEYQNRNAYDRQMYQQKLREKAALTQAGNENIYGGLDTAATVGVAALSPRATLDSLTSPTLTTQQQMAQTRAASLLKGRGGYYNPRIAN